MVFNLCESVDDDPHLAGHPAAALELLGIPFTGSPAYALMITTDKVMTKRVLMASGIRTPNYIVYDDVPLHPRSGLRFPVIIKPRFEDASIGIDNESIFYDDRSLGAQIKELYHRHGHLLVEEYIEGHEYNVSLFGHPQPRVLPVARIDFSALPKDAPRIVGYRAKWDPGSLEYRHTPRTFPRDLSQILLGRIQGAALKCFHRLMVRDYGRVDIRVDGQGHVYVLEVNANPCLSPDAGFAAAVQAHGLTYENMIEHMVAFVNQRQHYGEDPTTIEARQG
jgi:D-alanine-D-alanine ligase